MMVSENYNLRVFRSIDSYYTTEHPVHERVVEINNYTCKITTVNPNLIILITSVM